MPRGRFIVLEGGEGAGKSTQAKRIVAWLQKAGRTVSATREPGGTPLAEAIREVMLASWPEGMDKLTETLLVFAARRAHISNHVSPMLESGSDVVCDRFVDASYAYQGAARGVDRNILDMLSTWTVETLRPDLVLVFDLPPEEGLRRARARADANRFERESLAFANIVRATYLERAEQTPQRYAVIDASGDEAVVWSRVLAVLESRL
jgi:dTMP kinase